MKITKLLSKIKAIFNKGKEEEKAHPSTPESPEAVPERTTSGVDKQGLEETAPPPVKSVQENQIENEEKEKLPERDAMKAKERVLASEDTQRLARFNVVEAVNRSATAIEKYDSFKSNAPQSPRKGTGTAQSPLFKMISENIPSITESPVGFEPPELVDPPRTEVPPQNDNVVRRPSVNLRPEIAMDQTQKILLSADSAEEMAKQMAPAKKTKSVNLRIIAKDDTEKALCVDLDKIASTSTTTTTTNEMKGGIDPAPFVKNEESRNSTHSITKKSSLQVRQLTKEDTEKDMHVSNNTHATSPSRSNTNTATSIPKMFGQRKASISLKSTDPLSTTQKMLIVEPDVLKQDSVKKEETPSISTPTTNHTVSASSSAPAPAPARRASLSLKSDPLNTTLKMLPTEAVKEVEDAKE